MMSVKNQTYGVVRITIVAVSFLLLAGMTAVGQTSEPSPAPTPEPVASPTPLNYFIRDLPPNLVIFNKKYLSFQANFAVLADNTIIGQDSISRSQVGPQASKFDLRAARIVLSGQIKFKRPWSYVFAGDINELRKQGDRVLDPLDVFIAIPLRKKARIIIGKQKEPFIYELVGDSPNLPQQERLFNAFFEQRNIGVRYLDNYVNNRMLFSIGVYNDWFKNGNSFGPSGTQVSTRLTGLPVESKDGKEFLHLGVSFRYNGADAGKMRFRARPESNVTDYYVDTGSFQANYAKQLALESLYDYGPFSVLTEFTKAWVDSPQTENPSFSGFYIVGSYSLTGEQRPYDKLVGYARRIIPKSRGGAVELVGRFGYLDIDDTLIKGGKLKKWYFGANWWASKQWKFGVGYGLADLDKSNTTGRTQMLFTRLQWIY